MEEKEITTLVEYNEMEVTLIDLATRAQACIEPNKEIQRELQKTRTRIEKIGKFLREDFTRKGKEVIAKEKELIAIIQPHEERLKRLADELELAKEVEYRKSQFNTRSERLATLGYILTAEENEKMDDVGFEAFFQNVVIENNNRKERELFEREAKIKEIEDSQKREAEMKAREERVRKEAEEKAEREIAEANARAERAAQMERDKIVYEGVERNRKEAEEKKKLEADIAYQMFLESHGYTEETRGDFHLSHIGKTVIIYKLLGTFNPE